MDERTVEDRLREEYFNLLPEAHRLAQCVETEVRHCLLPLSLDLNEHESLIVTSRIKDCKSAINKLKRTHEGAEFDQDDPERYALTQLVDLVGVRVQAFPRSRMGKVTEILQEKFSDWEGGPFDHVKEAGSKLHGYFKVVSSEIKVEIQIVSRFFSLFWEVEHAAVYKPPPAIESIGKNPILSQCAREVEHALRKFETEFERLANLGPLG